jgi:hypothetical protein
MNTIRFIAYRRGQAVLIRGKVPVSPLCEGPFLRRVPTARPDTRAFRLGFRKLTQSTSLYAETLALVVHCEPEAPKHVRYLRILLVNDEEVVIGSCRPR